MNRNNQFFKGLFSGVLSIILVLSMFSAALAAGGSGGGGGGKDPVTFVGAYLTTISGNVSTTGDEIKDRNDIEVNPLIKLVFDKNVVSLTVWENNNKAISLKDSEDKEIALNVSRIPDEGENANADEKRHIFVSPKEPLTPEKTYSLTIDGKLMANNGTTMGQSVTITFSVAQAAGDIEAAQKVMDLIAALPEVQELALTDKELVMDARQAYNALTETQKELVTNLEKLLAVESKIAELEAEAAEPNPGTDQGDDPAGEQNPGSDQKDTPATDQNPGASAGQTPAKNANSTIAYPKTGDSSNGWVSVLGMLLLASGLMMILNKRRDKSSI